MISSSAVAAAVGVTSEFKLFGGAAAKYLPQRIAVFAQGATASTYSTDPFTTTSAFTVGLTLGWGSPAHLIALELFPANGDGVGNVPVTFYPLEDEAGATPSVGNIAVSGTVTGSATTFYFRVGGVVSKPLTVAVGASPTIANIIAAINGELNMPSIAADNTTDVSITSKWAGASANGIVIEVIGSNSGVTWTLTQPVNGATNPSTTLATAIAAVGNVWESLCINAMEIADTTTLDTFKTFGEGRWGTLVHKPLVVFTGNTIASQSSATAVSAARKDDRINAQLVAPGSPDLPFVVAARGVSRIAVAANNNPAIDYDGQVLTDIIPGAEAQQWDWATRDLAVQAGSSTVEKIGTQLKMRDTVTFYHPDGEVPPGYRYVNDIVKLQTIIFSLALIFASSDWEGAILIPDGQATVNPMARNPSSALAALYGLVDDLGLYAIISEPEFSKQNATATINSQNPRRIDIVLPVKLSGNAAIRDVTLQHSFYFGTAAAA